MEESTSDSTAANDETLKWELRKKLTEILSYGGETKARGQTDGVLEAIDEAISILNLLREVGSKMSDSDISSSSTSPTVEVPKEFKCTLSNAIMSEPVVIASGQTYEKRYVTEWLNHEHNCPKSNAVLSHDLWTTSELVDELIKQWYRANKYEVLKTSDEIVTEQFKDGIKSLLQRISSSTSSVEDQTEAANELCGQAKKFVSVGAFFVSEIPDSITQLLSPLSAVDSNPDLEKNIITALRYMSTFVKSAIFVRFPIS